MRGALRVARYELLREFRKKSLIILLVLALLPIPVALLLRHYISPDILHMLDTYGPLLGVKRSKLWAYMMGAAEPPPFLATASILGAASLMGFAWLAAILYGGDLLASDMRDSMIHYILVRPVRRSEYVLGKLMVVTGILEALFVLAGVVVFASSWIMFGPQEGLGEAIIVSLIVGIGLLPLLLTSSAIGAALRSPLLGVLLGFAAYFASSIVVAIAAVVYAGGVTPETLSKLSSIIYVASAMNPYTSYEVLGKSVYALLEGEPGIRYWGFTGANFQPRYHQLWPLAGYALAALVVSTVVLTIINWLLVARRDL